MLALGVSHETALAVSVGTQIALLGSVMVVGIVLLFGEQLRGGPLPDKEPLHKKRVV